MVQGQSCSLLEALQGQEHTPSWSNLKDQKSQNLKVSSIRNGWLIACPMICIQFWAKSLAAGIYTRVQVGLMNLSWRIFLRRQWRRKEGSRVRRLVDTGPVMVPPDSSVPQQTKSSAFSSPCHSRAVDTLRHHHNWLQSTKSCCFAPERSARRKESIWWHLRQYWKHCVSAHKSWCHIKY